MELRGKGYMSFITIILLGVFSLSFPCFAAEKDLEKQLWEAQAAIQKLRQENSELKEKIKGLNEKLSRWQREAQSWKMIAELRKSGEGGIDELNKELDLARKYATGLKKELKEAQVTISNLQKENNGLKKKIKKLNSELFHYQREARSWKTIAELRKSGEGGIDELNKELDLAKNFAEKLKKEIEEKDSQLKRARVLNWIVIFSAVVAVTAK